MYFTFEQAVTDPSYTSGKATLVSKYEPKNAFKIQSNDIVNLNSQDEPCTYTFTQLKLKETDNNMYLTCFEEQKK